MRRYFAGRWEDVSRDPPDEVSLCLVVNGNDLVTIQCSPGGFEDLGPGFLYTNGVIDSIDEITSMRIADDNSSLFIDLCKTEIPEPSRLVITSGFGGGPVFTAEPTVSDVKSGFSISPEKLVGLMTEMKSRAVRYKKNGGIHATALCSGSDIVCMAEDVGRQNSMDKVIGRCLGMRTVLHDKVLLTTGRVSFEMVMKTMRAGIPVLASLSAPTAKAVELASRCGVAVAGYVADDEFVAYSREDRFT